MDLMYLHRGSSVNGDSGYSMDQLPDWMDYGKYRRGQQFFQKHSAGIVFALHSSLTVGFVINQLLVALVFNKASDTPPKALRRYVETLIHIVLWHTTDVWDSTTPSSGHRSLRFVRQVHGRVARAMDKAEKQNDKVSSLALHFIVFSFIVYLLLCAFYNGCSCISILLL